MKSRRTAAKAAKPQPACLCMGLGPRLTGMLQCRSEEARSHMRAARIEFLKGLRALVDERLEQLAQSGKKGTSVPVE